VSGMLRLYPRPWRDRYGEEFEALLADRPPSVRHRLDIFRGALDAHRHPELVEPGHVRDRWWMVPLAGSGLVALTVLIMLISPVRYDAYGSYRDAGGAAIPWIAAVALLIAGVARLATLLPSDARALRVISSIGLSAGALWAIAPWTPLLGALFFGSCAVIAVGAWRAGVLPIVRAAGLVVAAAIPMGLFIALLMLPWYAARQAGVSSFVFVACLLAVWPLVSLCLHGTRRVDRGAPEVAPA
jgi:hypothetical protein